MVQKQSKGIVLLLLCIFVLPLAAAQIADDPETWDADFVQANPDAAYQTNPDRAIELYPEILYQPLIAQDYFTNNPETVLQYPEPAKEYFSSPENAIKSKGTLEAYGLLIGEFPEEVIAHPDVFGHAIGKDISIANQNKGAINLFAKEKWGVKFKEIKGQFHSYDIKTEEFKTEGPASTTFALKDFKKNGYRDIGIGADGSVLFTMAIEEGITYTLKNAQVKRDDALGSVIIQKGNLIAEGETLTIPKDCKECFLFFPPNYPFLTAVSGKNIPLPNGDFLVGGEVLYRFKGGVALISPKTTFYEQKIGTIKTTAASLGGLYKNWPDELYIRAPASPIFIELSPTTEVQQITVESETDENYVVLETAESTIEISNGEIMMIGKPFKIPIILKSPAQNTLISDNRLQTCIAGDPCEENMRFYLYAKKIAVKEDEKGVYVNFNFAEEYSSEDVAEFVEYLKELPPLLRASLGKVNIKTTLDRCPDAAACAILYDVKKGTSEIDLPLGALQKSYLTEKYESFIYAGDMSTKGVFRHEAAHTATWKIIEKENAENILRKFYGFDPEPTFEEKWNTIAGDTYVFAKDGSEPKVVMWDKPLEEPNHGCIRAYGCSAWEEDVATYMENNVFEEDFWEEITKSGEYDSRYKEKISLLCRYGFYTPNECTQIDGYIKKAKQQ